MKIAIDALPLLGDTGVTTYLRETLKEMVKFAENFYDLYFRISIRNKKIDLSYLNAKNFSINKIRIPNRILEYFWTFNRKKFPLKIFKKADIFWSTMYFVPDVDYPIVSTFYDITPLKIDEYRKFREELVLRLRNVINHSKFIISISEASKKDICEYFKLDSNKVYVTHLAASDIYRLIDKNEVKIFLQENYNIDYDYILYVGNMGPHKNITNLVKAYNIIKNKFKVKLILCGKTSYAENVLKEIEDLNLGSYVKILNFVPIRHLPYLYNGASLFVYPSKYEGFGLPVLEAMKCRVPVVTSNVSSLPEVGGDAALYVDPYDIENIANAILKVLQSDELKRELSKKSIERAKLFSWYITARKTLEVFKKAAL
jgi:glycosyltransferase involved in cell wall biosynthesis